MLLGVLVTLGGYGVHSLQTPRELTAGAILTLILGSTMFIAGAVLQHWRGAPARRR